MRELEEMLLPGEKVLWDGIPGPGFHLRKEDAVLIPFGIFFTGFAIFWEFSVLATGAPLLFKIWGIPFILAGLFLIFGRMILSARRAAQTIYGVMNRRILIVTRNSQKAIELKQIPCLEHQKHRNGLGSLFFDKGPAFYSLNNSFVWNGSDSRLAFRYIQDSEKVYQLLSQLMNQ